MRNGWSPERDPQKLLMNHWKVNSNKNHKKSSNNTKNKKTKQYCTIALFKIQKLFQNHPKSYRKKILKSRDENQKTCRSAYRVFLFQLIFGLFITQSSQLASLRIASWWLWGKKFVLFYTFTANTTKMMKMFNIFGLKLITHSGLRTLR